MYASEGGGNGKQFLSNAQLDIKRKIPCKSQLNSLSHLGEVVVTRFWLPMENGRIRVVYSFASKNHYIFLLVPNQITKIFDVA